LEQCIGDCCRAWRCVYRAV